MNFDKTTPKRILQIIEHELAAFRESSKDLDRYAQLRALTRLVIDLQHKLSEEFDDIYVPVPLYASDNIYWAILRPKSEPPEPPELETLGRGILTVRVKEFSSVNYLAALDMAISLNSARGMRL